MALTTCKHCGGTISTRAQACPHCGTPLSMEQPQDQEKTQSTEASQHTQPAYDPATNGAPHNETTAAGPAGTSPAYSNTGNHKSLMWWIIGAVALFFLLLLSGGAYFVFHVLKKPATHHTTVVEEDYDDEMPDEEDTIAHITSDFAAAVREYDNVGEFSDGLAAIKKDGQWGYINVKGEVVIPYFHAHYAAPFSEGYACVLKEDESESTGYAYPYVFIDKQGNEVFSGSLDLCMADRGFEYYRCPSFKDGKVTISKSFDFVTYDKQWNKISEGSVGFAPTTYQEEESGSYEKFFDDETGLCGLKDSSGNIVIPARYNNIETDWSTDVKYGVLPVVLLSDDVNDYYNNYREGLQSAKRYYGYVDLDGNDTFDEDLKQRCRQAYERMKDMPIE